MATLNDKTEKTQGIIHLMVTPLCDRDCKYCCNKQYDMNAIPFVTDEELRNAHTICITGGEPFEYSNPERIAIYYKKKYKNIKNVYVYTNAFELNFYIGTHAPWFFTFGFIDIDGLNISIKNKADRIAFVNMLKEEHINNIFKEMSSNRLYVFDNLYNGNPDGFEVFHREWQKEFVPSDDSIFRRI